MSNTNSMSSDAPDRERARDELQRRRFDSLWAACRQRVWRLTARLSGSTDDADDLTQQVAVKAYEGFPGFRGRSGLYTWLYRIAVNTVLRHSERPRAETVPLDAADVAERPSGPIDNPLDQAIESDVRVRVRRVIQSLPDDLRTTLVLQVYEGLKYREIAEVLNIPLGTVKSRLNAAVSRLQEELKDEM